jgi:myo-inositol-1(or 4)-monophosphatase
MNRGITKTHSEDMFRTLLWCLAWRMRQGIMATLKTEGCRGIAGVASSGDTTFNADMVAEEELRKFLMEWPVRGAFYSEDMGLVNLSDNPAFLIVADPIDGTRPAICGFESCVVSLAMIPANKEPSLGEVTRAIIMEIPSGRTFYAKKNAGVEVWMPTRELEDAAPRDLFASMPEEAGHWDKIATVPSKRTEIDGMFFAFELAGNPFAEVAKKLQPFVDKSSISGGAFMVNSSAFDLTRLVTGQLDAFLAVGGRVLEENPNLESQYLETGRGNIVGLFAYDIAAAKLIAEEAGCIVTDAFGKTLDDRIVLRKGRKGFLSCVAACTPELHQALLAGLDRQGQA